MAVKPVPSLTAIARTLIIWFAVPVPEVIDPGVRRHHRRY